MNGAPNNAFYLYGFTKADFVPKGPSVRPLPPASVSATGSDTLVLVAVGVDERHAPFFWCAGSTAAVLSRVSRDEFCGTAADSNLQDLAWVGPRAYRHEAVLAETMSFAPIFPARFGTLFSSLEVLGQFMERHRQAITQFLDRVTGQEEWAVKGLLDRARVEEGLLHQKPAAGKESPAASPGLAYLLEQRARLEAKQELEGWLAGTCNALWEALAPVVSEACQREVLSRPTTGADQEMVLNWAFLVPRPAAEEFRKRVEQATGSLVLPGLTFASSGPWPPYSFCPALQAGLD